MSPSNAIVVLQPDELSVLVSKAVQKGIALATKTASSVKYMNETQAAEFLSIKRQTLRLMRSQGRGPIYSKLGTMIRYEVSDLEKFNNKHKVITHG